MINSFVVGTHYQQRIQVTETIKRSLYSISGFSLVHVLRTEIVTTQRRDIGNYFKRHWGIIILQQNFLKQALTA